MDCDQVFMVLTRGRSPAGEPWDEAVEAHLESCADCWRLADALRPAAEVFQESVPPAESRDLPGYWGDARPAANVMAQINQSTVRTALASGARPGTQSRTWPARPSYGYSRPPLIAGYPTNVLRALVLASTLAATAVGLLLLWRGW